MSLSSDRNFFLPFATFCLLITAAFLTIGVQGQPILVLGFFYALAFWAVAWKYPAVAMMMVFAIAPIQNDLGSGGLRFSLTEIHVALLLPVAIVRCYMDRRPIHVGVTLIPVLLYFAVCIYSSLHTFRGNDAIVSIAQMIIYLLVVVGIFASFPTDAEQFRPALYGAIGVCCFIAFWSLATRNNFILGLGKNGVGQSLSCAVIIAVELWFAAKNPKVKRWLSIALALLAAGLVFSVSRGAWLGCAMGLILICSLRRQFQLMLRVLLVMMPLVAISWQFLPESTQSYATSFDRKRVNIFERYKFIDAAKGLWAKSPVYGSGVGLRKQYDATNLMWATLAESGVLGLLAFALVHVAFFAMILRTHKLMARDNIHYSVLLIGGALVLRHLTHGMVDHYWSRGAVTLAWGSAGMASYSYFAVRREMRLRRSQVASQLSNRLPNFNQRTAHGRPLGARLAANRAGLSRLPSPWWGRADSL